MLGEYKIKQKKYYQTYAHSLTKLASIMFCLNIK